MKLVLLGAPGSGKGTQAVFISEKLGIPAVSTGAMLRAAIKEGTEVGRVAKELVEAGKLVTDEVVLGILGERLQMDDCKNGYILDGVPRNISQAEVLERENAVEAALSIEVDEDEIERRMTGRRSCPGCGRTYHVETSPPKEAGVCDGCGEGLVQRDDDAPETVKARLAVYRKETEPLKAFYESRGKLRCVRGQGSVAEIRDLVFKALGIQE